MAKLSEMILNGAVESAPSGKTKLSDRLVSGEISSASKPTYIAREKSVLPTTKESNVSKMQSYSDPSRKLTSDEKKEVKDAYKALKQYGVEKNTQNQRDLWKKAIDSGEVDADYADAVINAYNKASAEGAAYDAIVGLGSAFAKPVTAIASTIEKLSGSGKTDWQEANKNREEALTKAQGEHKIATGAGQLAGSMVQYNAVNGVLGEGAKLSTRLLQGQAADTILDTIPEIANNYAQGKYVNTDGSTNGKELAKDVLKNQATNLAFNLGGEALQAIPGLLKNVNARKATEEVVDTVKNASDDTNVIRKLDSIADEKAAQPSDLNQLMEEYRKAELDKASKQLGLDEEGTKSFFENYKLNTPNKTYDDVFDGLAYDNAERLVMSYGEDDTTLNLFNSAVERIKKYKQTGNTSDLRSAQALTNSISDEYTKNLLNSYMSDMELPKSEKSTLDDILKNDYINPNTRTDLDEEEVVKFFGDDNLEGKTKGKSKTKTQASTDGIKNGMETTTDGKNKYSYADNTKSTDSGFTYTDNSVQGGKTFVNESAQASDYAKNATSDINGNGGFRESAYANGLGRTEMPDEVVDAFKEEPLIYKVLKNADTSEKADEILKNMDSNAAYREFNDMLQSRNPVAIPLGYNLAKQMVENGNTDGAIELIENMSKALTSSGQFSQAAAITMLKSDPMAAMRMMQKQISKINKTGADKYGKKWVDFVLTEDEIKAFGKINSGDTDAIQNLYEQITKRMSDNYPSTFWEKVVEASKTSMMLNPRTHLRNIAANLAMMPVRSLSDRVSALGQNIAKIFNPDLEVTQSLVGGTLKQKKIADSIFDEQIKPLLEGGNKWEDVMDNAAKGKQVFKDSKFGTALSGAIKKGANKTSETKVFKALDTMANGKLQNLVDGLDEGLTGSVMENLRRFDYYLLGAVEDDPFVKKNFSNRLASYMKAQGIQTLEDVPNEAIQTAYQEALKATFKDDNYMTKMFQGIKKSTGKFGEVILPFVKTPANLAKRGIEYSPIGFVDTLMNSSGKETTELIDNLAKNAVGTVGILIGYQLAKKGLIQGALSTNKKEKEFEKQQGKQAFSINVNGHYYTFDWSQPASIPLVIGATINDAIEESDQEEKNYLDIAKQSGIAAFDAWVDLSPLSSLQDILGGGDYSSDSVGENILNEVIEFPQRLIPAVSNATAKTIDQTVRQTYSKGNPGQTWIDTAKGKIPGLSETLPASYTTWGQEKKRQDSTGSAAIANFLNPGTLGYDASTPIDSEIERLRSSVGGYSMYPNKAEWSITDGDTTHNLTNEQYSEYQRIMGQHSYDMASALINNTGYSNLDDDTRTEMLSKIYSLSKSMAENELVGKEIPTTNSKLYSMYQEGGIDGVINYLMSKNIISEYGLTTNDKNLAVLDNYGEEGLKIQKEINNLESSNINNLIPVLDSYDISDYEKGEFIAKNKTTLKAVKDYGDDYEKIYEIYKLATADIPDANKDGKVNKYDKIQYLYSLGYNQTQTEELIPYLN